MFDWHHRLSVDALFGRDGDDDDHEPDTYVNRLKERMHINYQVAGKNAKKRATANKRIYDTGVKENRLEVGDAVLVQKVGMKGSTSWPIDGIAILTSSWTFPTQLFLCFRLDSRAVRDHFAWYTGILYIRLFQSRATKRTQLLSHPSLLDDVLGPGRP